MDAQTAALEKEHEAVSVVNYIVLSYNCESFSLHIFYIFCHLNCIDFNFSTC